MSGRLSLQLQRVGQGLLMSAHKVGQILDSLYVSQAPCTEFVAQCRSYLHKHLPVLRIHGDHTAGPHAWGMLVSTEHDGYEGSETLTNRSTEGRRARKCNGFRAMGVGRRCIQDVMRILGGTC